MVSMASFSHAVGAPADDAEEVVVVEALPDDDVEAAAENLKSLTWTTPMQID